jgi:hypothetical protein
LSLFSSILDKIFHHPAARAAQTAVSPEPAPVAVTAQAPAPGTASSQPAPAPSTPTPAGEPVDIERVLTQMASEKGGGGNWRTSIVDLLKLLDLDPSLSARKQLAHELNVHSGADGSAEQNIALQKAVMIKLAENGGAVPADMG